MDFIPYNSRLIYHKKPFGAVSEMTEVTFRVVLPRSCHCSGCLLKIHMDQGTPVIYGMHWERPEGDNEEWWCGTFTPTAPGLYFYSFILKNADGDNYITRFDASSGRISGDGEDFQLTVYKKDFTTPEHFKGSVMYQIFPDRFFRSGKAELKPMPGRVMRSDWGGEPIWEPDKEGKIKKYDYFGGDLAGIESKLRYLKSLGVGYIYLNPIFEAASNHRYDTADYEKIDPLLGKEADFSHLCSAAASYGIRIILDGVFSHTGSDSKYFNKNGTFGNGGAYNDKKSPYYPWYSFTHWPDKYECWWGVDILPKVNKTNDSYIKFIGSVLKKWIRLGAYGWRLDVADELPDKFLDFLRKSVKEEKKDALIIGEVWEDASNKISYGSRRRYLDGRQLDSVMNYPFANAVISFALSGTAEGFNDKINEICENYPKCVVDCLMNHIGTHDTCRVLNRLGTLDNYRSDGLNRYKGGLDEQQTENAKRLLMLVSIIQFTLPGVPCIYYGDEVGIDGGVDPFNRGCYPWGSEDRELLSHYRLLGSIRSEHPVFIDGNFVPVSSVLGCVAFERCGRGEKIITVANRNVHPIVYILPEDGFTSLTGQRISGRELYLDAYTASISVMSCDNYEQKCEL